MFGPVPAGLFRVQATRAPLAGLGVRVRRVLLVLIPVLALFGSTGGGAAADTPAVMSPIGAGAVESAKAGIVANYVTLIHDVEVYATGQLEFAAWVAAHQPPVARASSINSSDTTLQTSGGGGHSDAFWHGVTICEQGGRNDARYGFFSIMDGSAAGKSWADQEAIANGIIARAGDRAWAPSCVAAGYRASPSG